MAIITTLIPTARNGPKQPTSHPTAILNMSTNLNTKHMLSLFRPYYNLYTYYLTTESLQL